MIITTSYNSKNLSELLQSAARRDAGSEDAFTELYRRALPKIRTVLLREGLAEQDFEDVYNATMFSVWKSCPNYESDGTEDTALNWMFKIAGRRYTDFIRQQSGRNKRGGKRSPGRGRLKITSNLGDMSDPNPSPSEAFEIVVLGKECRAAISRLSGEQSFALSMNMRDAAMKEVAAEQGIPHSTINARSRLARGHLANDPQLRQAYGLNVA